MAMRMLGNSSRGLTPQNKRILYRACVLPIATYGHRLWFYEGAKNIGALKGLTTMQRKAACWIIGAFRTAPTVGVEALAGLPPVRLHLQKLSKRAIFRTATLSDTHPLRSILKAEFRKGASPHYGSATHLSAKRMEQVKDAITETNRTLGKLTEEIQPCAPENQPGQRLKDLFPDRIKLEKYGGKKGDDTAMGSWNTVLNLIHRTAEAEADTVICGTDASVPLTTRAQAASAAIGTRAGTEIFRSRWMAGKVLSADAELFAIRIAVVQAVSQPNCSRIVLFTDSMASADKATNPSPHSGQGHSLAVCRALAAWFEGHSDRKIMFVQVPSILKWGIHQKAHDFVRDLPAVPTGRRPATSLDTVRKETTQSALDEWQRQFLLGHARGSQFLDLRALTGGPMLPTYLKGGTWMHAVAQDNALCARVVRCITNHAPTGEYYSRFNIEAHLACPCDDAAPETRAHIFLRCKNTQNLDQFPRTLESLITFLQANPQTFAFRKEPPPGGVG